MKRVWAWVALGLLTANCRAEGIGQIAAVTLIDRDSGITLPITKYRGEYWVAGRPGARYAIEIANHSGARVMAVTSVDGVNVLSGATAAWDQNGHVFERAQHYQISGWRKTEALGVISKPRLLSPYVNPFPGSPDSTYVPDPPG
jgi:hypothetical protein